MPEPGDPWDTQHSPNKIIIAEKDKRVSSTQSCSEELESIKQKGTRNEEAISRSGWKGIFNPAVEDSNYLGKMTRMEGSQKAEKVKRTK